MSDNSSIRPQDTNNPNASLEEALRINWILMQTLNRIEYLLFRDHTSTVSKHTIHFVIKEGLDAIIDPKP